MASGEYLRLRTVGRRTGSPHDVIVRFLTTGGKVVIFPQNTGGQDWVANVQRNPRVQLFGSSFTVEGTAAVRRASGPRDPLLAAFTRKYGEREVRKRYWGQLRYVEVEITSRSRSLDYEDLVYSELEAAFDGVAESYDEHIMGNEMNLWLRNRSTDLLKRCFRPGERVLEIGCGTGTETLALAGSGVSIIASDISSKMLAVLGSKAKASNVQKMVTTLHARPYELKEKLRLEGVEGLDGAYSTYGAVNTDPSLPRFFGDLFSIIRPNGTLVIGVWNRFCLSEILGYTLRMKPQMAVGRMRNPVPVGKSRFCIASNAYTVGSMKSLMKGLFEVREVVGVEIFLPPSNLVHYLPPRPLAQILKRADVSLEAHFPWNRLGDHFLLVCKRS